MQADSASRFRTFQDLEVYQVAREFRKRMYQISHKVPEFEKYALATQIRRAAVSVTNNIAEGHGRYHYLDQVKFLLQARGSVEELIDDLTVCADERYAPDSDLRELESLGWRLHQLINGYGRYLRRRKAADSAQLHETSPLYSAGEDDPFGDDPL
ncbi:MAG TPA: four helix bundle protein [Verrucomicrobiae bacterium]